MSSLYFFCFFACCRYGKKSAKTKNNRLLTLKYLKKWREWFKMWVKVVDSGINVVESGRLSSKEGDQMFMGEYNHTIDEKGRLIIPSKFREELGNEFVVTKGLDGCLFAYDNTEWSKLEERLKALPFTNKDARAFTRFMLAGAASVELDKQGRILLPSVLRTFAGLDKDVVLIGVASRIEIWNKEKWDEASDIDNMDDISERMADLGI